MTSPCGALFQEFVYLYGCKSPMTLGDERYLRIVVTDQPRPQPKLGTLSRFSPREIKRAPFPSANSLKILLMIAAFLLSTLNFFVFGFRIIQAGTREVRSSPFFAASFLRVQAAEIFFPSSAA